MRSLANSKLQYKQVERIIVSNMMVIGNMKGVAPQLGLFIMIKEGKHKVHLLDIMMTIKTKRFVGHNRRDPYHHRHYRTLYA